MKPSKSTNPKKSKDEEVRVEVSTILGDGEIVEAIYMRDQQKTAYLIGNEHHQKVYEKVTIREGLSILPPKATNNLLQHSVMLLPSGIKEYGDAEVLLWSLEAYFRRYCDLRPEFIKTAASYVMLSWLYDRFNELPYLRLMGSYGTGKTRFLLTVGSVAYRPLFGSGASTVSPIFHLLHEYRGTLILDEADFRFSDKSADITKILNNGNVRGFPVLRCAKNEDGNFDPKAFSVYGPKIIATRGRFQDPALESRFITEVVYPKKIRDDIPINLPNEQKSEAEELRNQLLLFRFRNWHRTDIIPSTEGLNIEGRVAQIFRPLLSVIPTASDRAIVLDVALKANAGVKEDRSERPEVRLLHALIAFYNLQQRPSLGEVSEYLRETFDLSLNPRRIGALIRMHFALTTAKSGGVFKVVGLNARKLRQVAEVLGVVEGLEGLAANNDTSSPTSTNA